MAISPYLAALRAEVGPRLLLLPAVTGFVFDADGRLLVARHTDFGHWAPPGGGVDPDESPEAAVVRELAEEVGVEVEVRGLIGVFGGPEFRSVYPNGDECAYVNTGYALALVGGSPTPDLDEISEVSWVNEEEAATLDMPVWAPRVLPVAFAWWDNH